MNKFSNKVAIEEVVGPQRVNVAVGDRVSKVMPASECMMHMKLVDQRFDLEASPFGLVQLFKGDQPFGSKVTTSEAGLMFDEELECYYFYDEV